MPLLHKKNKGEGNETISMQQPASSPPARQSSDKEQESGSPQRDSSPTDDIEAGKNITNRDMNIPIASSDAQEVQVQEDPHQVEQTSHGTNPLGFFERWLTLWVLLAMVVGTLIGYFVPSIPAALEKATVNHVWIPGAVLVWFMVYPMMLGVRWSAFREVPKQSSGIFLTCFINWAVQPFVMYGLAVLFFDVIYKGILDPETRKEYIAGAVILGGSPCTAMVFVWSALANGDPNYTLAQVVVNDLILLVLYVPTTQLLLHLSDISLPWGTVFLSVALFVVIPFVLGAATQAYFLRKESGEASLANIQRFFKPCSAISLVLLVVFIFISQAQVISNNFTHVLLIAIPLVLQTSLIFLLTYSLAFFLCLKQNIGGPAAFIGSSNFFELAVALSLTVYGPDSGAVLVAVVGVLVEVPVMLLEVAIVNATKQRYENHLVDPNCQCNKLSS